MIDRGLILNDKRVLQHIRDNYIPVAIDQANQRRQQDAEGKFYRRIAKQGPRNDFELTTQGFYLAAASGKLLSYTNNRTPDRLLQTFERTDVQVLPEANAISPGTIDRKFSFERPKGTAVVRVNAKVLGGFTKGLPLGAQLMQLSLIHI